MGGVDPEIAQRKLAETMKAVKRYQHAVAFFFSILVMEFIAWPLLSIDVIDLGGNEPDTSYSFKFLGQMINYKSILTFFWIFSIFLTLILMMGVCFGDQGEGCCLRFHRKVQYAFLAFNFYFFLTSWFKWLPFGGLIADGYWTALACHLIIECFFRFV